jgi:AbrB family looped-hinge helix DNA binding protein
MPIVKTYAKGLMVIPKEIRDALGIRPGRQLSINLVGDHAVIRPLPNDPIEFLTGIFKDHPKSLAGELLKERKKDDRIDEKYRV